MVIGMPFWELVRRAVSSPRDSSTSAKRLRTTLRSSGDQRDQPAGSSKARRAAATAASASAVSASGTEPIRSPVAGDLTSILSDDEGVTHTPPMRSFEYSVADTSTPVLIAMVPFGGLFERDVQTAMWPPSMTMS
jgi:hypothetical protein